MPRLNITISKSLYERIRAAADDDPDVRSLSEVAARILADHFKTKPQDTTWGGHRETGHDKKKPLAERGFTLPINHLLTVRTPAHPSQ